MPKGAALGQRTGAPQRLARTDGRPVVVRPRAARACERADFLASVAQGRAAHRARWDFAPDEALTHEQASAVDRRAVRDALVAHDLLADSSAAQATRRPS